MAAVTSLQSWVPPIGKIQLEERYRWRRLVGKGFRGYEYLSLRQSQAWPVKPMPALILQQDTKDSAESLESMSLFKAFVDEPNKVRCRPDGDVERRLTS